MDDPSRSQRVPGPRRIQTGAMVQRDRGDEEEVLPDGYWTAKVCGLQVRDSISCLGSPDLASFNAI